MWTLGGAFSIQTTLILEEFVVGYVMDASLVNSDFVQTTEKLHQRGIGGEYVMNLASDLRNCIKMRHQLGAPMVDSPQTLLHKDQL